MHAPLLAKNRFVTQFLTLSILIASTAIVIAQERPKGDIATQQIKNLDTNSTQINWTDLSNLIELNHSCNLSSHNAQFIPTFSLTQSNLVNRENLIAAEVTPMTGRYFLKEHFNMISGIPYSAQN